MLIIRLGNIYNSNNIDRRSCMIEELVETLTEVMIWSGYINRLYHVAKHINSIDLGKDHSESSRS